LVNPLYTTHNSGTPAKPRSVPPREVAAATGTNRFKPAHTTPSGTKNIRGARGTTHNKGVRHIRNVQAGCYTARAGMTRVPNKCGWLKWGRKESCGLSEAIQNLPPELREMLLKEYIAIKIKEKNEMGWADGYLLRL